MADELAHSVQHTLAEAVAQFKTREQNSLCIIDQLQTEVAQLRGEISEAYRALEEERRQHAQVQEDVTNLTKYSNAVTESNKRLSALEVCLRGDLERSEEVNARLHNELDMYKQSNRALVVASEAMMFSQGKTETARIDDSYVSHSDANLLRSIGGPHQIKTSCCPPARQVYQVEGAAADGSEGKSSLHAKSEPDSSRKRSDLSLVLPRIAPTCDACQFCYSYYACHTIQFQSLQGHRHIIRDWF